jgi:ubiquinone/menaquinone biosynthesis C-methylase UbiE
MEGLEPLFQEFRIRKIWPHIQWGGKLVDFGCDFEQTLLKRVSPKVKQAIGIDIVSKPQKTGNIEVIQADLQKRLPLKANSADTVTMLAVLEHLPHPEKAVAEAFRVLKPGGVFLVTVPSPRVETILPILAKVHLVRQEMIDQHENYFTHESLRKLMETAGFTDVHVESWELGCNTFVKAVK